MDGALIASDPVHSVETNLTKLETGGRLAAFRLFSIQQPDPQFAVALSTNALHTTIPTDSCSDDEVL